MKMRLFIFILAIMLLLPISTNAVPITISITGNITSISGSGVPSSIYIGSIFTATYTYDTSTPDSDPETYNGSYKFSSPYGMNITLGGYQFQTAASHIDGFNIGIRNDDSGPPLIGVNDWYTVGCSDFIPSNGIAIDSFRWHLIDPSHTAFSSDALPITAPVLSDWEFNSFYISGFDSSGKYLSLDGTITQAVLVPEPLTISLLIMGLSLCKRRR
jgi:hypothetical protein